MITFLWKVRMDAYISMTDYISSSEFLSYTPKAGAVEFTMSDHHGTITPRTQSTHLKKKKRKNK